MEVLSLKHVSTRNLKSLLWNERQNGWTWEFLYKRSSRIIDRWLQCLKMIPIVTNVKNVSMVVFYNVQTLLEGECSSCETESTITVTCVRNPACCTESSGSAGTTLEFLGQIFPLKPSSVTAGMGDSTDRTFWLGNLRWELVSSCTCTICTS